jgi:hypothetical protein
MLFAVCASDGLLLLLLLAPAPPLPSLLPSLLPPMPLTATWPVQTSQGVRDPR